jgi:predicted MPP superfamily phosphohydrolase
MEEGELIIRRHKLPAPWLPDRLRGLTITHVSDLHVGRLYRPYLLPRLVDVVNGLDSDIVLVTGDIIDNSNDMLPDAVSAIGQFRHRHGLFLCIGNHDEIDDRAAFIRYTRDHLPLLINERRSIEIGGERITIGGLDYSSGPQPRGRRLGDVAAAEEMLLGHRVEREGPVIALAHHPHAFDTLAPLGVPLTLSGHTHGGQIMFTPPGMRPDLGLGQVLFHYIRGFYRQGSSNLYVNSGVGNWFPLRIHAPAEVAQIQLVWANC